MIILNFNIFKKIIDKGGRIIVSIIFFIIGLFIIRELAEKLEKRLMQRMPSGFAKSAGRAFYYISAFILGVVALWIAGVSISGLLVAGGIVGVAIGFAAQTTVSNLLSGLFLYLDRPMDIGDAVELDGISGIILDIAPISSKFRTWDGKLIRLPNESVFKSKIINYTKAAAMRIEFDIGISYESDVDKAIEIIKNCLYDEPFVLIKPEPEVYLNDLADSAIMLKVKFWSPRQKKYYLTKKMLHKIYNELTNNGIEIPYPQLDVHLREKDADNK